MISFQITFIRTVITFITLQITFIRKVITFITTEIKVISTVITFQTAQFKSLFTHKNPLIRVFKTTVMKILIEGAEDKLAAQLHKFRNGYSTTYAALLKVPTNLLDKLDKGSLFLDFVLDMQSKIHTVSSTFTSYKNLVLHGHGTDVLGALPVLTIYPTTPAPPPICDANVAGILREIAQVCVNSGNLTEDIAKALGLFEDPTVVSLASGTPDLSLKSMSGGHPMLHTVLNGYDGFEVWKDSGIGAGFVFHNVSTSSDFTDQSALPALGVEVVWKYKIIYRLKNLQIGNWSATISVAVKGNV